MPMHTMKKIALVSTLSPFYGSKVLSWRIHDSLLKYAGCEIVAPLPVGGGQSFADRLYSGDTSVLYPTLRPLNIQFRPCTNEDFDCVLVDSLGTYSDTLVNGVLYDSHYQRDHLMWIMERTLRRGGTVVFMDVDGWSLPNYKLEGFDEYVYLWKYFNFHPKVRLMTNFETPDCHPKSDNTWVIPFEIDPTDLREIRPIKDRPVLLSYIGHQNQRLGLLPFLNDFSKHGPVNVYGKGWLRHIGQAPQVSFHHRVPATHEFLHKVYGSSKLGIITHRDCDRDQRLRLYLLRWRELAIAGVMITIEDDPFFKWILKDIAGLFTTDRMLRNPDMLMHHGRYESLVEDQRRYLLDIMGVEVLQPKFNEALFG